MMKQCAHTKKVSRKVQGLFDGSLVVKVLTAPERKKNCQKKVKDFHVRHSAQNSKSLSSPAKIDILQDFDQIPIVPTIDLTEEQVHNLIATASSLHEKFAKYGAVKLRLPKSIHPQPLNLAESKRKLTVRQQVLPLLLKGRAVANLKEVYDYDEFKELAKSIEGSFKFDTPECHDSVHKYLRDEREYFGIVHSKINKPLDDSDDEGYTVEYAADLAIDRYVDMDQETLPSKDTSKKSESESFSLRKIYTCEDSMFQLVASKTESISGIVVPWAYVASKYSTFAWHTEDLFLYSFNYMHEGGCKTWYTVPLEDVEKFRAVMLREYQEELKKRPTLLDEVTIFFSPLRLVKEGVDWSDDSDPGVQGVPGGRRHGIDIPWRIPRWVLADIQRVRGSEHGMPRLGACGSEAPGDECERRPPSEELFLLGVAHLRVLATCGEAALLAGVQEPAAS